MFESIMTVEFMFGVTVGALLCDVAKKAIKHRFNQAIGPDEKGEDSR